MFISRNTGEPEPAGLALLFMPRSELFKTSLSLPFSMMKHLLNSIAASTLFSHRVFVLGLVLLGLSGWLPTRALGQEARASAPQASRSGIRSVTAAALAQGLIVGQAASKGKMNWPLWIGIGGGGILVVVILIAIAMKQQRKPAPPATAPDVIGGYTIH